MHGVDVTTTAEAGLLAARDEQHVAFGLATGRVILTQDEDFLKLHAQGVQHRGIAYCAQHTRGVGHIISGLLLIWEIFEPEEMTGRVEYL